MRLDLWNEYQPTSVLENAKDLYTRPHPSTLIRTRIINESGMFRLSRRDCSLTVIEIKTIGSWGRLIIFDGEHTPIFDMPSIFTGSFAMELGCHKGLIINAVAGPGTDSIISFSWREKDLQIV